jgi:4-hydroxythreonine-4-phosphate dehydrogenase
VDRGTSDRARLAVTLGDVRGIGPEIILKAAASSEVRDAADLVFIGPRGAGMDVDEQTGSWTADSTAATAGRFAGRAVERAVALALEGDVDGIVTAPLDKAALLAGGYSYPGHTEMLATLTGRRVAMMLAATKPSVGGSNPLRVVLATTHLPLRDVVSAVTMRAIVDAATVTRKGLQQWFGIDEPRIALCALNPHAGDGGRFGTEDDEILRPAAEAAGILGPFPADTAVRAMREFDAVIAPYQTGMTASRSHPSWRGERHAGLPLLRYCRITAALDIAGKGTLTRRAISHSSGARIAGRLRSRTLEHR